MEKVGYQTHLLRQIQAQSPLEGPVWGPFPFLKGCWQGCPSSGDWALDPGRASKWPACLLERPSATMDRRKASRKTS